MSTAAGGPPRSALLASWGCAWLAGDVSLPDLVRAATASDQAHVVEGLSADDLPLDRALALLRAGGVQTMRVVLPAPGDVVGLPGPGPFTSAALSAAEGLLALRPDRTGHGLVPTVTSHASPFDGTVTTVRWTAYAVVVGAPDPGPALPDAEHDLRRGLLEVTRTLRALDVAAWRSELAEALHHLRAEARAGIDDELPDGYPLRARSVLVQARNLAGILQLAGQDLGGALDSSTAAAREQAIRQLQLLVRRARVAAYNSYGLGA